MRRIPILVAVLILTAVVPAHALPGFEAGARGMYWFPDLSGNVQTFVSGVQGTQFDIKDDLNVGDENFPSGEAFVRIGRLHFRVGYTPVKFDGNKQLTRQIVFNGQTFIASDNVVSQLDLKMIDGELQFDLLRPDLGVASMNLGVIVKVKFVDGNVELNDSTTGQVQKKDFKAPIPMVGVAAGAGFLKDMVRADARVTGISYSGNHLFEVDAYASFSPLPFLKIQGGYRLIDLKIDEDDIEATLKLRGPYLGAQLSF
jgi:outer membrane protein